MSSLRIRGVENISGQIEISGNKNAVLPMIAAACLCDEPLILHNVPDILDLRNMLQLANHLGVETQFEAGSLHICAKNLKTSRIPKELCHKTRTSFLFAGPLTARCGEAELFPPGGDVIGKRRLDSHFYGLKKLGFELDLEQGSYKFKRKKRMRGSEIFFDEASVTATEHIMMCAALAEGKTIIRNAACEPHVTELARLLNKMGARIEGMDSNVLHIEGVEKLQGAEFCLEGDHIEAASYLSLCAACGGDLEITGEISPHNYWMLRRVFERFGLQFTLKPGYIRMQREGKMLVRPDFGNVIPVIADGPWPQFPSDMMSCMITVATQAEGTVLFFEKMFESRIYFVDKLISMGANAVVCDPHRVLISGPARLHGSEIPSPDIRAGMALIIAACCASGESLVKNADMVFRGYSNLLPKLKNIGCDIMLCET
ncbi:MAG: UDP-N-acetylglucosamine 1-carboxyvinyltransferase [Lentisphaeria bacterium]|nr:UDP-N-acetylglucosamine 1-carboxyvinyltransferase [Lentisphaeria bacterium]NLZ60153.1 UDP-N-acetylglucosamine 1-carboxyvinyltransferase [Lentisphaerota bacterium]